MTVASTNNRMDYTGNGSTSVYSYNFRIFANTDLTVTVRNTNDDESTLLLTTDYTVSGVGDLTGGNVTLVNSSQSWLTAGNLTTNYILTIRRVLDLEQNTDIRNQGEYFPEDIEDEFDRGVMIAQQQQDDLDRSLKLPESVSASDFDPTLPATLADNPGSAIIVNSAGDGFDIGINNSGTDASKVSKTGDSMTGDLGMLAQKAVRLHDANSSNAVFLKGPTDIPVDYNLTFPAAAPAAGSFLQYDGTDYNWNFSSGIISSKSASYVVLTTDGIKTILMTTGASTRTVTLPAAASSNRRVLTVKKVDSGAGLVTLDGNASETVDGALTKSIALQYESITVQCDGSNWHIIDLKLSSDYISFTPTGTFTTNTTYTGFYRRIGGAIEVQYNLAFAGAPNSVSCTVNMPSGFPIDTTKLVNSGSTNVPRIGEYNQFDLSASAIYTGIVNFSTSTTLILYPQNSASTFLVIGAVLDQANPVTIAINDTINIRVVVPCSTFGL